ncbi:hypothetical protein DV702_01310 [Sporosarcina sp. PTS2304]|nr:hypothetical protein DV702_01310 [Sporosarcina sp. PTS2304]
MGLCSVAQQWCEDALMLPSHPQLTNEDVKYIVYTFADVLYD